MSSLTREASRNGRGAATAKVPVRAPSTRARRERRGRHAIAAGGRGPARTPADSILERLRQRAKALPPKQEHVARHLAAHLNDIAFLSVEQLAEATGSSPATIVRLATSLGYSGYAAVRREAAAQVRARISPLRLVEGAPPHASDADAFSSCLRSDADILAELSTSLRQAPIAAAARLLWSSRRVIIFGVRSSAVPARLLGFGLRSLRDAVETPTGEAERAEMLVGVGPRDALCVFCFPRYARGTVMVTDLVADLGARIVAITDNVASPVGRHADVVLQVPFRNRGLPLASVVGSCAVVNGLLAVLSRRVRADTRLRRRLQETETSHRRLRTWTLER